MGFKQNIDYSAFFVYHILERGDLMSEETNTSIAKEEFERVATETVQGLAPTVPPVPIYKGRKKIMTNYLSQSQVRENMYGYEILNESNIVDALNLA